MSSFCHLQPGYNLSSYQWRDRPFMIHGKSNMYIFTKPDDVMATTRDIQLCSYFSVFVSLLLSDLDIVKSYSHTLWSRDEIMDSNYIHSIILSKIPNSIECQVDLWRMHFNREEDQQVRILASEYRVCLFGVKGPISAAAASKIKAFIEHEIQTKTSGTKNSAWYPSHAIPRHLLH